MPFEAIGKRALVAGIARARCARRGRGAARATPCRTARRIAALVRWPRRRRQGGDGRAELVRAACAWALDFALPPRCAGCGDHRRRCPQLLPRLLEGNRIPRRMRLLDLRHAAAGDRAARPAPPASPAAADRRGRARRSLTAIFARPRHPPQIWPQGRDRADHGALHGAAGAARASDRLLVPVPLHRSRLWQRASTSRRWSRASCRGGWALRRDPSALARTAAHSAAQGHEPAAAAQDRRRSLSRSQTSTAVAGKTVILVDDVLTTGSTAEACARTLKRAGAARVELVSWARVVKPSQLMR